MLYNIVREVAPKNSWKFQHMSVIQTVKKITIKLKVK